MGHRNLRACLDDLERAGRLRRVECEVDPYLEMAEIQRRVYRAGGPALLFPRVKGSVFPMAGNVFGTADRTRYIFRDTLAAVRKLVALKVDPAEFLLAPWRFLSVPRAALTMLPRAVRRGPVLDRQTSLSNLPRLVSWPGDGGPFVTLPLVYTEDPDRPGWRHSNLGMYRVQLAGNEYEAGREVGMHYQIHRGIGVHHAAAVRRGERLPVNVVIGGPPALTLAAVMPLPEGMTELLFAGALGGRRVRLVRPPETGALPVPAEADFCIRGWIDPTRTKPEGPFGDHLGYYSLRHDFPVMTVTHVSHRRDAIGPFPVVGRPPQEDTSFGEIIHELTGPLIPTVIPGVRAVHAVDAAGVHPLLLALGSERYVPYAAIRQPQELLTQANAILGQGQLSLAKYLFIAAGEDRADLDLHDIVGFFRHVLERVDWRRDLHFQTRTTLDTLDYSAGMGLNAGSKLVAAAAGPPCRVLATRVNENLRLPAGFSEPRLAFPGVVCVRGPKATIRREEAEYDPRMRQFVERLEAPADVALIVVVDDSEFAARSVSDWLWVTFTRSDPASDIYGVGESTHRKHWGCAGPLVIDARLKPHHAPPLVEDPAVTQRVDALGAPGGPLHGII